MSDRRITGSLSVSDPVVETRMTVRNPFFANTGFAYDTTVEVKYTCNESELDEVAAMAREHLRDQLRAAREEGIRERDVRNGK